jgi:hypothetical protein
MNLFLSTLLSIHVPRLHHFVGLFSLPSQQRAISLNSLNQKQNSNSKKKNQKKTKHNLLIRTDLDGLQECKLCVFKLAALGEKNAILTKHHPVVVANSQSFPIQFCDSTRSRSPCIKRCSAHGRFHVHQHVGVCAQNRPRDSVSSKGVIERVGCKLVVMQLVLHRELLLGLMHKQIPLRFWHNVQGFDPFAQLLQIRHFKCLPLGQQHRAAALRKSFFNLTLHTLGKAKSKLSNQTLQQQGHSTWHRMKSRKRTATTTKRKISQSTFKEVPLTRQCEEEEVRERDQARCRTQEARMMLQPQKRFLSPSSLSKHRAETQRNPTKTLLFLQTKKKGALTFS